MAFTIGAQVGAYKIVEKLGRGGMATVYKAYHSALDRHVAIKVLHATFKDDDSFLRRFSREAKVVARLEHTHIVHVYDFSEHDGYPYLVMRYVAGETLKERMSQGRLPKSEITRIATAVAQALDYAHQQGVLHRDIKPSNILLTQGGGVYIADFGLARMAQAGESTMSQDMIMGTPQYISPEQAKGVKEIDGRTDVYSFGIILYELVTGRVPFQSDTSYAIIHSQIFDPPPPPSELNDKVGPALEATLLKALSKEPADRYQTAGELARAFRNALLDLPTDIAPAGAAVLPDYTPLGVTQVYEETPPPLPDLSDAPASEVAPGAEETKKKKKRPLLTIIGGIIGICLCLFALAVINNARNQQENEASPTVAIAVTEMVASPTPEPQPIEEAIEDNLPIASTAIRPIEELEKLHETEPDNIAITAELAAAYINDGQRDKATDLVQGAFGNARLPMRRIVAAERLLEIDELDMAAFILEAGMEKSPDDYRLQHLAVMTEILREADAETMDAMLAHIQEQLVYDETSIQIGRAHLAYLANDNKEALRILNETLTQENREHQAEVLFLKGVLHRGMGEESMAQRAFEQALESEPPLWLEVRIIEMINN
ncbi:MAG: protein kinase [Chloroflexi bacterium]|nr:protein kinase [Chloroflexota bacterium]